MFEVGFSDDAEVQFFSLDHSIQLRIQKKINQMKRDHLVSRHMRKGLPYFVEEISGFRIAFTRNNDTKIKKIWFVGDHKAYERWYQTVEL